MTEALKHDKEKLKLELIPPEAINSLGEVLTFGAKKYGERNWENGFCYSRLFGALMRHLWAFWGGEDIDAESGLPHLYHAHACIAFLVTHYDRKIGVDDRYTIHKK